MVFNTCLWLNLVIKLYTVDTELINLYPANKMENLLLLLNKISQVSPLGVFNQEVIVVQNAGMQHWLNLAIAKERGISMNMHYALPAQYLWQLIRTLASDDKVPEQSPYSREVLTWRIYALLATKEVVSDNDFTPATRYWSSHSDANPDGFNQDGHSSQENLKRYQLAAQMADLYEQYLIFRPQWLDSWQSGEELALLSIDNKWQATLWQLLVKQLAYNPIELLNDAIANIGTKLAADPLLLPKRLSFFGINSMAPMWLTFINALSDHIEVDFFHLNPCFSYWGDIISEKQAIKKLSHWSNSVADEHIFVGNPLLANLGQQGREFLALLQDYSTVNVDLFVKAANVRNHETNERDEKLAERILHRIQNDILELEDATKTPVQLIDDSITITSCHSALREVQALHDYLLHQFNDSALNSVNNEDRLTPKDVLVMCPQIEQYAPYVNAVFTRGWQDLNDEVPPLPCSIADRSAKDSDPLIAAFSELLSLPDSRFQVSQLLSFIRLSAVANKFAINEEDSEKISLWLEQATVHWGLDQAHKEQLLGENASNSFTWQQGLSRLIRGFAFSDTDSIYQEQLLLAAVEGDDALLLGQLMLFIEQLQTLAKQLNTARTVTDWQSFLLSQLALLFSTETKSEQSAQVINQIENSLSIIEQAIAALVEYCSHAHFSETIDLAIVVDFLNNHFSQGDASRQFMVGQVTFCSMLPMRSIPFKVIAVLGLNDGEFPRQRQPLGFDLMAQTPAKLGDRSRRGDDRYLFLEALISARDALYLSFQGRNIKNNNEKQPSIVLKELMEYLSLAYGWQLFSDDNSDIRQLAMQPYSEKNYLGQYAGFDAKWLALQEKRSGIGHEEQLFQHNSSQSLVINCAFTEHSLLEQSTAQLIDVNDVIRFYQHPSRHFGQKKLALYLDNNSQTLADDEPFDCDHLTSYLYKQQVLEQLLMIDNEQEDYQQFKKDVFATTTQQAQLSGRFPHLPQSEGLIKKLTDDSEKLADFIVENNADNAQIYDLQVTLEFSHQASRVNDGSLTDPSDTLCNLSIHLDTRIQVVNNQLVAYRSSLPKGKDFFALYINLLILQVWQQQNPVVGFEKQSETAFASIDLDKQQKSQALAKVNSSHGYYFDTKGQKPVHYYYACNEDNNATDAKDNLIALLKVYLLGQQQALLLNGDLAEHIFKAKSFTQSHFDKFWSDDNNGFAFGNDPYIQYFWRQCPALEDVLSSIQELYLPIITTREQVK